MKIHIAVATLCGKAYYLIVNELRKRNMQFLSLVPNGNVPVEVRVVITTEKEKHLVSHDKILVFSDEADLGTLVTNALKIAEDKEIYERIVIGVDPGEVLGLAVQADERVVETRDLPTMEQAVKEIDSIVRRLRDLSATSIIVKVGDSSWIAKTRFIQLLDDVLPANVILELVKEAGTSHCLNETKNRRGLRDIGSAIRIAARKGRIIRRGKAFGTGC